MTISIRSARRVSQTQRVVGWRGLNHIHIPEREAMGHTGPQQRQSAYDSDMGSTTMAPKGQQNSDRLSDTLLTWGARVMYIVIGALGVLYYDTLQLGVSRLWGYLLTSWIFNSVYFETWFATVCYPIILIVPCFILDKVKAFDRYKMDKNMTWTHDDTIVQLLLEAVVYCAPLAVLDTFMVKRYCGVDPEEWAVRRESWIQTTRALPMHPPTVTQIGVHCLGAFVLYDLLFFAVHYLLHRNLWLYKHLHATHHNHETVQSRVTNKLSVPERIVLVLSANFALKLMGSHPLTRAVYVPLFLAWLVENHCGYDFPWTLNKVVPGGLVGGAPAHQKHHVQGTRHYQPFFTYIDNFLLKKSKDI